MANEQQAPQKPTLIVQMEHLLLDAEDEIRSGRAYAYKEAMVGCEQTR